MAKVGVSCLLTSEGVNLCMTWAFTLTMLFTLRPESVAGGWVASAARSDVPSEFRQEARSQTWPGIRTACLLFPPQHGPRCSQTAQLVQNSE